MGLQNTTPFSSFPEYTRPPSRYRMPAITISPYRSPTPGTSSTLPSEGDAVRTSSAVVSSAVVSSAVVSDGISVGAAVVSEGEPEGAVQATSRKIIAPIIISKDKTFFNMAHNSFLKFQSDSKIFQNKQNCFFRVGKKAPPNCYRSVLRCQRRGKTQVLELG